jgi:deoxyadenosine/deoxycytidine kinase
MLDFLRKFKKNSINNHISDVLQTIGIERATPTLLQRMLKSTIGFSDLVENNNHSKLIQQKYDFFLKNSMLSDCYFYLGYTNKENFVKIKDALNRKQDLIHILKIAFDIEVDPNLLLEQAQIIQSSCNDIFEILSNN